MDFFIADDFVCKIKVDLSVRNTPNVDKKKKETKEYNEQNAKKPREEDMTRESEKL